MSGIETPTATLSDVEALQASDILVYAGRSPRWQTRQNAAVAWAVLAASAREQDGRRRAAEGLVNSALHPLEVESHTEEVSEIVAKEIGTLDPELREYAYKYTIDIARGSSIERGDAARFAIKVWPLLPARYRVKALMWLWLARLGTMTQTWRRCAVPVGLATAAMLLIYAVVLSAAQVGRHVFFGPGLEVLPPVFATAMLAAGIGVPSRYIRGPGSAVLETVVQALIVGACGYLVSVFQAWLGESPASRFARGGVPGSTNSGFDAVIIICSIGASRLAMIGLPHPRAVVSQMVMSPLIAGSAGSAVALAMGGVSVWAGAESPAAAEHWLWWSLITFGASCGMAWVETLAPRPRQSAEDGFASRSFGRRWVGGLALAFAWAFLGTVLLSWYLIRGEIRQADDFWRQDAVRRSAGVPSVDCGSMADGTSARVNGVAGDLFKLVGCNARGIRLTLTESMKSGRPSEILNFDFNANAFLLDSSLMAVDSDSPPSISLNVPRGDQKELYYLCVALSGNAACARRVDGRLGLASAIVRRLTSYESILAGPHEKSLWTDASSDPRPIVIDMEMGPPTRGRKAFARGFLTRDLE